MGEATVILCSLLFAHKRYCITLMRRNNIHLQRSVVAGSLVNDKLHISGLAGCELHESELAAYRCPSHHIAITGCY